MIEPEAKAQARILIVDDEPFNIEILSEHLESSGYLVEPAYDGQQAWEILQDEQVRFDAILLDRMMPRMNGMELLAKIKQLDRFKALPVILQTAMGSPDAVREGLQAGAYYYLTKPFERETLLAIVAAAVRDRLAQLELLKQLEQQRDTLTMLRYGEFQFRTLAEAKRLTALLSSVCPQPEKVAMGLSELLINAVEHGNLGITYKEKTKLIQDNAWEGELNQRLALPQYAGRRASVMLTRDNNEIRFVVADQGDGFDWKPFMEFSPDRAFDPHGRGISMARMLSFDSIEYQGNGNTVLATVKLG
ncbi:MAG: response regulator [Neisseriaceae bacterium]|nr:MAG: response regulator [Neisseriaceae bacterium]